MARAAQDFAYQKYVEYWNGKIKEMQPKRRRSSRTTEAPGLRARTAKTDPVSQ
jgi:hypothetical protein